MRWQTGPGAAGSVGRGGRFPGQIELSGQLQRARATAVARYLPLGIAASARDYVAAAVRDGRVPKAVFRVKGDLWDFPFAQSREGEFHVAAQVQQATLAYVPEGHGSGAWPPFTQIDGELVFDRGSMSIRNAQARLWGIELKGVNGSIRDLIDAPALEIEGAGRGPLTDALRFVDTTPVGGWTHHVLGEATGTGAADLKLALRIPLDDADKTTVRGTVTLAGNEVRLRRDVPLLSQAKARIEFTQRGFIIAGASARALGGELSLDGGSVPDGSVRVTAQGVASADGLRRATELGALARLAGAFNGQAPYRLVLGFGRSQTEFNLTSPMTGMALDLPAPLRKTAAESWPLKVQTTLATEGTANPNRDTLRVELGSVLQAEFQRELTADTARVQRGVIGLGDAPPAWPATGVAATARLGAVSIDDWLAQARRLLPDGAAGVPLGYAPTELQLRAQSLSYGGRSLTGLNTNVQRRPVAAGDGVELWRASLQSEQAQGQIEWQTGGHANAPARIKARLGRLVMASADTPADAAPADASASRAAPLPALDIVVDDLEWRGRKLGRLEVEAAGAAADARDWRVARLSLVSPEARLSGSGLWSAAPRRRMQWDLKLELADSGALLERLGMGRVVRGGKGRLQGQIGWNGGPFAPEWSQMSGTAQLALDGGQILKVEPGAGRLLGVLSLQSLPRRLTLDFRDVFQEGFAFDNVSGDLALAEGIARTRNLRIRGPQAAVLVEGQADLKRETQDLRLVVVPEINAGTASLAYAAINPAIGLGTFLAQYLLRRPLQQASTREFHVTGPWDHPAVEAIERKPDAPLPDMEASGASAPSADTATR